MIKLLFISYCLPPLLSPQSIQIARFLYYLKKYDDLKIVVITADEIGSFKDYDLYPDVFDNLEVIYIKNKTNKYLTYIKNRIFPFLYQKPDLYIKWMNIAYEKVIEEYKNFDLIMTFSFPLSTNILGKRLKNFYKCRWIAHNSDPWVDNPHLHIPLYMKKYHQKLEEDTFQTADKLLFTSKEASQFYKQKYPKLNIDYINHSFDKTLYPEIKAKNERYLFRYIGTFYGKRTPKPLFEALKLMDKNELNKFEIELIGAGKKAEIMLKAYSFKNVKVLPPVNYLKSLELMKTSDCLLVIDAPVDDINIFFPSKLADYIGSERPIFGISPRGTTSRILNELGYICCGLDNPKIIKTKLLEQIENNYVSSNISSYDILTNIKKMRDFIDEK